MPRDLALLPDDYQEFLSDLKTRISESQVRAGLAVNHELVMLYWRIGRDILMRQQQQGWGAKIIDRLAKDLIKEFPDMKGFSVRNLKYMRAFADAWPDESIVQQAAAQIPWFHNCLLLDKSKDLIEREWYIQQTIEHGWSRDVLRGYLDRHLYERQGKASTNFTETLPSPQSDLAQQILKDPYNFDFLTLGKDAHERELERGLTEHIREFLLEMGTGFAFMGNQYRIEVSNQDYYIDLLFYHVKLHCYVVVDLKMGKFEPEFVGKMNFYLSAVDDLIKGTDDQPSIGLILCRTKDKSIAEYTMRGFSKPIGISAYDIMEAMPEQIKTNLPTIEELEAELSTIEVVVRVSSERNRPLRY